MFNQQSLYNGIPALCYAAARFDKAIDPSQLSHQLGNIKDTTSSFDLCRCAGWIGLKAKKIDVSAERLAQLPVPALLETDAGWLVLEWADEKQVCLYQPESAKQRRYPLAMLAEHWQGQVILLAEEELTPAEASVGFNWFIPALRKHIRQFRSVVLVSLMLQLIALVTPFLFQNVIDKVLVSRSLNSLQVLGIAMLALAIAEPVYGFIRSWLFANLSSKISSELSSRLYQHLITLPLAYFQQRQTGQIIARVGEMDKIRQFLTGSALSSMLDLVFIILFFAVMFAYSVSLTAIVAGSLVIYLLFWLLMGPLIRRQVSQQFDKGADNTSFLTEAVMGIETIKSSATEKAFIRQWEQQLAGYTKTSFRAGVVGLFAGKGIALIQKLTAALLLWWGVKLVLDGMLSPGQLVAFNMLSGHVTQPILRLAQIWQDFQHTLISLRRIGDILEQPGESGSSGLASLPAVAGAVSFQGVRFRYNADTPEVLQNLNLDIEAGQFIGITGPSGSGKSTLTKLLQRLYTPQHGQVLLDGVDLAIADPVSLRRQMSIVLQESFLFSGTIAENIRLAKPQATDEDIVKTATLVGAHHFISELPQGYNTQVGEKGGRLSGGQRQRVALARALITNPKVLLLDEATSALDYESEAAIISNMAQIAQGRTVISIAHRLNTIRQADRILVIKSGQVVEQGRHDELIDKGCVYSGLWQVQTR